jgi:hypothetical protein
MRQIFIYLFLISFCAFVIGKGSVYLLNLNSLIYSSLSEKLTTDQLNYFFEFQANWNWVGSLLIPFFLFLKTILVSCVLYIGTFFFSKTTFSFKQLWFIAIKGEVIFLLVPILKLIWFYFFQPNFSLEDIQFFYPLSVLNVIGYKGIDVWLIYPFQVFNVFEIIYVLFLSYQIGYLTKTNADNGLKIVGYSYIPALFLWVAIIMFFTLNYS